MEIVFCEKKNNILVHDEMAWNPETEIAVYKIGTQIVPTFRIGCTQIYNYITTFRVLSVGNNNIIHDYIKGLKGKITAFDDNFETVMREESLENALGLTQIIKIDFTTTTATNGKNCLPCDC